MKIFILEDKSDRILEFKKRFEETGLTNLEFYVTDNVEDAKSLVLKNGPFDMVFLDHDLGEVAYETSYAKNTGSEFSRWLFEKFVDESTAATFDDLNLITDTGLIIIHSYNFVGAKNMLLDLDFVVGEEKCFYMPEIWRKDYFHKYFIFMNNGKKIEFCTSATYENSKKYIETEEEKTESQ